MLRKFNLLIGIFILLLFHSKVFANDAFSQLTNHMRYLTERDAVLSKNIANSDTPHFKPYDLKKATQDTDFLKMKTTNKMHISAGGDDDFYLQNSEIMELKPNGNAVTIEHEMMKKSENAMKLQETASIYTRARNMLKTAATGIR